jgi:hypothetical protein
VNAAKVATAAIFIVSLAACSSTTGPAAGVTPPGSRAADHAQTTAAMPSPTAAAATTDQRPVITDAGRPPVPGNVNNADPNSVARAVVITTNQFDTRTDTSSLDALRRAGRWLTPALLAGSLAVPQRTDAAWTTLVTHRGYTTVDHIELANEYGQPPNTATTQYIQISYQVHDLGRDSCRGSDTGPQLARLQLIKQDNSWKVKAFD